MMKNKMGGGRLHGSKLATGLKLGLGIPVLLLALAAWVVALAGVSVVRNAVGTDSFRGNGLGESWFVIFGTLFTLLVTLIYLVGGRFSLLGKSAVTGLLAIFTTLCIIETLWWNESRVNTPYSLKEGKGAVTAFAGFLTLATLNAILLMIVGTRGNKHYNTTPQAAPTHVQHRPTETVPTVEHQAHGAGAPVTNNGIATAV